MTFDRETCRAIAKSAVVGPDGSRIVARVPQHWFADLDFTVDHVFVLHDYDPRSYIEPLARRIERAIATASAADEERRERDAEARARDAEVQRINTRDGTRLRRSHRPPMVL